MREHEVPTHVQAEDRVLLGFTFPQVVAVTAVCALSRPGPRCAYTIPLQGELHVQPRRNPRLASFGARQNAAGADNSNATVNL